MDKVKKKALKPRFESIECNQIADVWRIIKADVRAQVYPDSTASSEDELISHFFAYLQSPSFIGIMARIGRRPAGVILGNICERPIGNPTRYANVFLVSVDPAFRGQTIGLHLINEYRDLLKKNNVFNFEAAVPKAVADKLEKIGIHTQLHIVGGRV